VTSGVVKCVEYKMEDLSYILDHLEQAREHAVSMELDNIAHAIELAIDYIKGL